jgi:hypothetical protein
VGGRAVVLVADIVAGAVRAAREGNATYSETMSGVTRVLEVAC